MGAKRTRLLESKSQPWTSNRRKLCKLSLGRRSRIAAGVPAWNANAPIGWQRFYREAKAATATQDVNWFLGGKTTNYNQFLRDYRIAFEVRQEARVERCTAKRMDADEPVAAGSHSFPASWILFLVCVPPRGLMHYFLQEWQTFKRYALRSGGQIAPDRRRGGEFLVAVAEAFDGDPTFVPYLF